MPKPRDTKELYETAIHEAGHAVASIYTRAVFSRVTIRRRGDTAGRVISAPYAAYRMIWNDLPRNTIARRVTREAIILGAGALAEMLYAKRMGHEVNGADICEGGSHDAARLGGEIELLVRYGFVDDSEEARDRAMQVIMDQACDLLIAYWPGVIALADALMQTPTIGYRRARRIILEATP
jgi:hypothetical protein